MQLPLKYNYISGKMKWKMWIAFTKMHFNGPDFKESRKSDCFQKCFYGKQNKK